MPKFTFIGEHVDIYGKPDGTKITYEFTVERLNDILEHTDLFVRGCGFSPPSGILDYVIDEFSDYGGGSTLQDYELHDNIQQSDNVEHSGWYFDTERNK